MPRADHAVAHDDACFVEERGRRISEVWRADGQLAVAIVQAHVSYPTAAFHLASHPLALVKVDVEPIILQYVGPIPFLPRFFLFESLQILVQLFNDIVLGLASGSCEALLGFYPIDLHPLLEHSLG